MVTVYLLWQKSPELTLICVGCALGHVGIQQGFANMFYVPSIKPIQDHKQRQNELIRDYYEKMEIYRTHHKEDWVITEWADHQDEIMKHRKKESYTFGTMVTLNFTTASLMMGLMIGLYQGMVTEIAIHEFVVYILSIFQLFEQSVDVLKDLKSKEVEAREGL
jgi:ABC-type multidrug transport system fused ATPase/permease subunit